MFKRLKSIFVVSLTVVLGVAYASSAYADQSAFDLAGPSLDVDVTRGTATLPLAKVPALAAGDKLLFKVDLPESQSAQFIMVAAFLRGPTNPPPKDWFFRCDTWKKKCLREGLTLTVPKDAQQLLVFFVPRTGGDYKTLLSAVQGRPGAFVRAAQELNQAALDRLRLEHYLNAVRRLDAVDPTALKETAPLLARSLAIKVDEKCLDRLPALQAPCLMQGQNSMILNDGSGTSVVATLTSGPASDLALQAGSTPALSSSSYVPYIGSILDLARLMDSFRTAHFQYIPALPMQRDDHITLMLNTPPSFHEPQSVLVAALPAIESSPAPIFHAVESDKGYCAKRAPLVLPVDGAPIAFATHFAHDLILRVKQTDGSSVDMPVVADATAGGLLVDASGLQQPLDETTRAQLHGVWGFEPFDGPQFTLLNPASQRWALTPGDESALVVGREDTVHLQTTQVSCVKQVAWSAANSAQQPVVWKRTRADQLEVKLPLLGTEPGPIDLWIEQYGSSEPAHLQVNAYADVAHLEGFTLHAGDDDGVLKGTRLDQVASLSFKGVEFSPGDLAANNGVDNLTLQASDEQAVLGLRSGDSGKATVRLKDGRTLKLDISIASPRPKGMLLAKSIERKDTGGEGQIQLSGADEMPPSARLTFSIKTQTPAKFGRDVALEIATADGTFSKVLNLSNGGLTLENSRVAVASFIPAEALGPSAFGDLQFRLIAQGSTSDWQNLATLVRLPDIAQLDCPDQSDAPCLLKGSRLFLIESLAADAKFAAAVTVPDGYPGYSLTVPRPTDGSFFVKLRDDPDTVNRIVLANPPPAITTPPLTTPPLNEPAPSAPSTDAIPDKASSSTSSAASVASSNAESGAK